MVCPICRSRWAPSDEDIEGTLDPVEDEDLDGMRDYLFNLDKIEMCSDCAEDEF